MTSSINELKILRVSLIKSMLSEWGNNIKKTRIQLKLKQVVSLAVLLLRPQADFKSAHWFKIVNIYTNVNYLKVFELNKALTNTIIH